MIFLYKAKFRTKGVENVEKAKDLKVKEEVKKNWWLRNRRIEEEMRVGWRTKYLKK